ncbi:MAG: hypothetical protein CMK07_08610 [Ponticaulis sp.]|nr:hypothetical protein [Ponticaulis sp.]
MIAALGSLGLAGFSASASSELSGQENAGAEIDQVLGDWTFSTKTYRNGTCSMSGSLFVFDNNAAQSSAQCQLTAVEVCGQERSIVEQTCTLELNEGGAVVSSEIVQFLERKPSSVGYLPDNFDLYSLTSDKMTGELDSAVSSEVEFRRREGSIS